MSLSTIAALALQVGPAAIRGIASMFGGNEAAEKVADIVEVANKTIVNSEVKEQTVVSQLHALPLELQQELLQLRTELEKEVTERQRLALQDAASEHRETQQTVRAGDVATDQYVRRTRPKGCLMSLYFGMAYVFSFELLQAYSIGSGADWQIASFFFAPFMTYLGWRSADKHFEQKHGRVMQLDDALSGVKAVAGQVMGAKL